MSQRTIGILGCGWLGLPLAEHLNRKGYRVKGTTTSEHKLPLLRSAGAEPFQLRLHPKGPVGDIHAFLNHVEFLVIAVPPGLRSDPQKDHVAEIGSLLNSLQEAASLRKLIYISSTSVFPDREMTFDEASSPEPDSDSGRQLAEIEKLVTGLQQIRGTVLRFGGLFGGDRHPVKFLSGKQGLASPHAPVNLIDRQDCIGLITSLIESEKSVSVCHGVSPYHPEKSSYYGEIAARNGLLPPEFDQNDQRGGKRISSANTCDALQYRFLNEKLDWIMPENQKL
ncbi:sugar nucleotide-binding protein [Robertkochia aurantiaca]|uniref:sugar nucleotide-binding protein n=1 Tax=Robertkochia aurantiaca TaxID=2873700 RepID=UPI001CCF18F3|nr:sugar nucleotide-binding protein [Robertkochia sp. 3YJGBD-33]